MNQQNYIYFPQRIIMNSNLHDASFYSQSKQNSSSVQQLYEKFESLKHRIVNSDAKKLNKSIDKRSMFQNKRKIVNIYPLKLENQKYSLRLEQEKAQKISNKKSCSQSSLKDLIENNLFSFIFQNMQKLEQNMKNKIIDLEKKLNTSSTQLRNLKSSIKKKEKNEKITFYKMDKLNCSCQDSMKQKSILSFKSPSQNLINLREVSQISKKYQEEIKSIIQTYQNKISILISEGSQKQKNTKASSSFDKKSQILELDLLRQCKTFQQKLLLKQQELNELKIDSNRLKRMLDQSNKNYESNSQLNRLLKQQNKQLQESIKKLQTYKKNWATQKKQLQFEIEKMKIHQKRQVKVWKQQLKRLNLQLKTLRQSKLLKSSGKIKEQDQRIEGLVEEQQKIHNNSNALDDLDTVKSQSSNTIHKQDHQFQNLQLDLQSIHGQIKQSQSLIFNKNNKSQQQKQLIYKLKSLQAEANLLSEQNRLLKMKKDKFQQQVKNSEEDQERFQQQGQIFKSQIKRLNGFVRKLQDCGIILLKKQQLTIDKVNELEQESRLKQLFYKTKVKVDTQRRGNSCRK